MTSSNDRADRLSGLFNITVTPFAADGAIDGAAFADAIERVIAQGFDGLLIGGTYGEFATMDTAERADLFRRAVEVAAGRVPLLLCTADSDPRVVRDLTALAEDLGEVPMVMPPYVSEVNDDHIVAFFEEMAKISQSIMIYNAPGVGITLSPALIERLAGVKGVIAMKQGALHPLVVDDILGRVKGRLKLFCASDLQMLGPIAAGFDGVSSTNSCAFPELIHAIYHELAEGNARKAGAMQHSWQEYRAFALKKGQPQTTKAAMTLRGWVGGHVRAPLLDLGATDMEALGAIVKRLGY